MAARAESRRRVPATRGGERPRPQGRSRGAKAALARAACLLVVGGCGEPVVDAIAVWVEDRADMAGDRRLHVYEAGERRTLTLRPTIPGSDPDLAVIAIDSRAHGIAFSGNSITQYFELGPGGGRLGGFDVTILDEEISFAALQPPILARNGDAVLRRIEPDGDLGPRWAFMPTRASFGMVPSVLEPPRPASDGATWNVTFAADAPVMIWAETSGNPTRVQAIIAMAYPSDRAPGAGLVEPLVLARGEDLMARGVAQSAGAGRSSDAWCPQRMCVAPSGRVVYLMDTPKCVLWRWSWIDRDTVGGAVAPTRIELPDRCPVDDDPWLTAVLDDDAIVLDDQQRFYVFDHRAGVLLATPKLGNGLAGLVSRDEGHALVAVSFEGEVQRIDADGPRIISTERGACSVPDAFAVSPSGAWVVMSCATQTLTTERAEVSGVVQRVSVLGLEQFAGISMRPLAIDDDGNALLYSFRRGSSSTTDVPRGLYVLSGDGELSRVDELEPAPAEITTVDAAGTQRTDRFATSARP